MVLVVIEAAIVTEENRRDDDDVMAKIVNPCLSVSKNNEVQCSAVRC